MIPAARIKIHHASSLVYCTRVARLLQPIQTFLQFVDIIVLAHVALAVDVFIQECYKNVRRTDVPSIQHELPHK